MAPIEITIHDLLNTGKYVVPLYQRNYAWGEVEITQLLQDVWDKYKSNNESNYYIGTLVVDRRSADVYEIIDGQQRHTTVTLINAVIHSKNEHNNCSIPISNLTFDARDDIKHFIDMLLSNYEYAKEFSTDSIGLSNIKRAIRYIESFIERDEVQKEISQYLQYFYHNIKIVRIGVPENTDINHYFEIMNNRGEQLEQHEILKAKFIDNFEKGNEELCDKFAIIWDACSQMDKPIQSCFDTIEREILFGKFFTDVPSDGISKPFRLPEDQTNTKNESVHDILNTFELNNSQKIEKETSNGRYRSIIDFPNFLLQVLKVTAKDDNISLDDKNLLKAFNYPNKIKMPSPEIFINALLYYRTLFDRYVIKREEANDDWSWKLICPIRSESTAEVSYKNTFGLDDDEGIENRDFIMLQSMIHVSFPGNNYKNWLQYVLKYFETKSTTDKLPYLEMLRNIADTEFRNIKTSQYNWGTHTPRYLFNYLDYILWNEYDKNVRGKDKGNFSELQRKMLNGKDKFNSFKFTQNNSVEHVAPQNPIDGSPAVRQLNSFGNLCLISSSTNSRLINLGFDGKKEYFKSTKSVESLKQTLIFSHAKWDDSEIDEHQKEVLSLLEYYNYETANLTTNISVTNETELKFSEEGKIDRKETANDEILVDLKNKLKDISAELKVNIDFDEPDSLLGKKDTGFWLYKDDWKYCIYFYFRGNNKNMYVSVDDRNYANRCDKELAQKIRIGFADFFIEQNDMPDESKMWSERFPVWDNTSWSEVLSVIPFHVTEWSKRILGKISELKLENV